MKGPAGRPGRLCGGHSLSRRMFFFFGLMGSKGSSSLTASSFCRTQGGKDSASSAPGAQTSWPHTAACRRRCLPHLGTLVLWSACSLLLQLRVTGAPYTGFSTRGSDTSRRASPLKSPIRYLRTHTGNQLDLTRSVSCWWCLQNERAVRRSHRAGRTTKPDLALAS